MFNKLPQELRIAIWQEACRAPRVINVEITISGQAPSKFPRFHSPTPPPAMLHVNAEAHDVALKFFRKFSRYLEHTDETAYYWTSYADDFRFLVQGPRADLQASSHSLALFLNLAGLYVDNVKDLAINRVWGTEPGVPLWLGSNAIMDPEIDGTLCYQYFTSLRTVDVKAAADSMLSSCFYFPRGSPQRAEYHHYRKRLMWWLKENLRCAYKQYTRGRTEGMQLAYSPDCLKPSKKDLRKRFKEAQCQYTLFRSTYQFNISYHSE